MKIYTRTGDLGETGLLAGPRVGKDVERLEVCGSIDELSALLGLARGGPLSATIDSLLARTQGELLEIGAELATPDPVARGTRTIGPQNVQALEAAIDQYDKGLPELKAFILPGGASGAGALHVARAVCRRAERRLVTLVRDSREPISLVLLAYMNRLGDLLFVLARAINAEAGRPDEVWKGPPAGR